MRQDEFDHFTYMLASGVRRRDIFKSLIRGITGGLLGHSLNSVVPAAGSTLPQVALVTSSAVTNGRVPCVNDPVTFDSLTAAHTALDAGAEEVALSPQGCIRYRRKLFGNGDLAYESMLYEGRLAERWNHTTTQSNGQRDGDGDGFFEWHSSVFRGASTNENRVINTIYAPSSGILKRRETYTRNNDRIRVLWEETDDSGTLRTVAQFEASPDLSTQVSGSKTDGQIAVVQSIFGPSKCSDEQEQLARRRLSEAQTKGTTCLRGFSSHNDGPSIANGVDSTMKRKIDILCDSLGDTLAMVDPDTYLDPTKPLRIILNNDPSANGYFFQGAPEAQQRTLFHELLHPQFGPHRPGLGRNDLRYGDADRTEACTQLCFNDPRGVNQCQCATCLATVVCDEDCKKYNKCQNESLGAICPCFNFFSLQSGKFYPTCSQCLANCPSGLACFGINTCLPVDVSCNTKKLTCP